MSSVSKTSSSVESKIRLLAIECDKATSLIEKLYKKLEKCNETSDQYRNELVAKIQELNEKSLSYQQQIDDLKQQISNKPEKEESKQRGNVDRFDHATGWNLDPRHNVHLISGRIFNVWNKCAPFGSSVGAWEQNDEVSVVRKGGGLGLDPYVLTNLNLENSSVVGHLKK